MRRTARTAWAIGAVSVVGYCFLALCAAGLLGGCAAAIGEPDASGRKPVVLGWDCGKLTDAGTSALFGLGESLGGLVGIGAGVLGPLGVLAVGWARASRKAAAVTAASDEHDLAWDEAERRTLAREAPPLGAGGSVPLSAKTPGQG